MNQEQQTGGELRNILDLVWRRKWVILVPFVIIATAVTLYGLYIPNLYRSTTSIFIEPAKVPADYVKSTVTTDLEGRLRTITQQLTSRTKLLKVIKELNLYSGDKEKNAPDEVMVARMRKNLSIEVPNRREANFFQVSFLHKDPTKAMLGVSRLMALFIEESIQGREEQAVSTTQFIKDELAKLKKTLEKQESAIQSFKGRHMGELPGQLDANLRMLDNLNQQLTDNLASQRELENRVAMLEQDIARLEGQARTVTDTEPVDTMLTQIIARRDALRQRVTSMESTYTPRHPDLIAAKKELAALESRIQEVRSDPGAQPAAATAPDTTRQGAESARELNNLRRQLSENQPRLSAIRGEEKGLRGKIAMYQRRVEAAPKREQQLLGLSRDYDNTKASYDDLLNKRMEAQLSENLEKRQKGEKFQILDPANLPEKPFLPNRFKIIAMGVFGGLGLGIGLALLLESLFPAFYSLKQVRQVVDAPILMVIPRIVSPMERRRNRIRWALGTVAGATAFVLVLFLVNQYVVELSRVAQTIGNNLRSMI
ncbi:MAG: hypothetical protein GXP52_06080 [Deltaproteobacteria bacterium]|nr:hypothetical protein [Deltaproteobacteria bacterium]